MHLSTNVGYMAAALMNNRCLIGVFFFTSYSLKKTNTPVSARLAAACRCVQARTKTGRLYTCLCRLTLKHTLQGVPEQSAVEELQQHAWDTAAEEEAHCAATPASEGMECNNHRYQSCCRLLGLRRHSPAGVTYRQWKIMNRAVKRAGLRRGFSARCCCRDSLSARSVSSGMLTLVQNVLE